jgi:hypothetical protein
MADNSRGTMRVGRPDQDGRLLPFRGQAARSVAIDRRCYFLRSPRSPWPFFATVLAFCRWSAAKGTTHVGRLLETPLLVAADVALVRACVDEFPIGHAEASSSWLTVPEPADRQRWGRTRPPFQFRHGQARMAWQSRRVEAPQHTGTAWGEDGPRARGLDGSQHRDERVARSPDRATSGARDSPLSEECSEPVGGLSGQRTNRPGNALTLHPRAHSALRSAPRRRAHQPRRSHGPRRLERGPDRRTDSAARWLATSRRTTRSGAWRGWAGCRRVR